MVKQYINTAVNMALHLEKTLEEGGTGRVAACVFFAKGWEKGYI